MGDRRNADQVSPITLLISLLSRAELDNLKSCIGMLVAVDVGLLVGLSANVQAEIHQKSNNNEKRDIRRIISLYLSPAINIGRDLSVSFSVSKV
jgi:hypothetical protein